VQADVVAGAHQQTAADLAGKIAGHPA